jgi:hypothetical protein
MLDLPTRNNGENMAKRINNSEFTPKRRSATFKDDIGESLFECKTIADMVKVANKTPGVKAEKLSAVVSRVTSGLQLGLARMQIGNLIRGAIRRAEKGESKKATKEISPKSRSKADSGGKRKRKTASASKS